MNLDLNMQAFNEFQMPKILDIVDENSRFFLLLDADGGLFPLAIVKKCFVLDVMPYTRI